MAHALLLYALPLATRFALQWPAGDPGAWADASLSLLPLIVQAPSLLLPRAFGAKKEVEHVARHAVYATAFSVAAVTGVRWTAVLDGLRDGDEWAVPLVAYLAVGTVTLWWFCAAHCVENSCDPALYTHQGDVAVLPLTLVAIATFAESVPDDAFRFARSVIFFVPVIVAWATLHFCAYLDFATRRVTTYSDHGFDFLALAGLVVATAQLVLLEVRAPPLLFQLLPPVAAIFCQVTRRHTDAPLTMRGGRMVGQLAAGVAAGAGVGGVLSLRFDTAWACAIGVVGCVTAQAALPPLAGRRWVGPGALYAALVGGAVLDAAHHERHVEWDDAAVLVALFYAAFRALDVVAPSTTDVAPPPSAPTHPNDSDVEWPWASLLARLPSCDALVRAASSARVYDADTCDRFLPASASCPPTYAGVWWTPGNHFPQSLVSVQHATWTRGGSSPIWDVRGTSRDATAAGLWLHCLSAFVCTAVVTPQDEPSGRWVRTDKWMFGPLRWFPVTYWVYRWSDDVFVRVVSGRTQYRMVRVARGDGTRTVHHAEFLRACGGRAYLLWP